MPHLPPSSLSAQIDETNRAYAPRVTALLTALQTHPAQHARFLNMLSFLEHRGSRKIMVSQMHGTLGLEVLKHLSEETRHAFFFKRQAERVARRPLFYNHDDCTAFTSAAMYFGRLDATAARHTKPEWGHDAGYYLVSLIIELRAGWLYHLYQDVLVATNSTLSLKSLIAEEAGHLRDMTRDVMRITNSDNDTIQNLIVAEQKLFEQVWQAIENDVQNALQTGSIAA